MFSKKLLTVLLCAGLTAFAAATASAQKTDKAQGWGAASKLPRASVTVAPSADYERSRADEGRADRGRDDEAAAGREDETPRAENVRELERLRALRKTALVGTWHVKVGKSDGGLAPFEALHTFNADGTFVETSSLLATLTEGPAHGVWEGEKPYFSLTFQLFVFDDKQQPAGMVRVRNTIIVTDQENTRFTARYAVDFIAPDGTVEMNIDTGTYEGRRIKVLPVN
jgi:hypothetical protein